MNTRIAVLFLLMTTLFCFTATTAQCDTIAVWGSTTCQKQFLEPGADAFNKATGHSLTVAARTISFFIRSLKM